MATIEHLPPEIQDLIRTRVYKRNLPKVKSKIPLMEPILVRYKPEQIRAIAQKEYKKWSKLRNDLVKICTYNVYGSKEARQMKIDKLLKLYKSYMKLMFLPKQFSHKLYEIIFIIGKEKPDLQPTGIEIEDKLNILINGINFNTTYTDGQKTQILLSIFHNTRGKEGVKNFNKNQIILNKITEYAVNKHPNLFCDYLYSEFSTKIQVLYRE
jgi:hypothetical protein